MSLDAVREDTMSYLIPRFNALMASELGEVVKILADNHELPNTFPFAKFIFVESEGNNAAIGGSLERNIGFMQADVYVKENTGTKKPNIICQGIKDVLTNVKLSLGPSETLTYYVGKVQPIGIEKGRYRQMVRIPYLRDTLD